MKIVHVVTSLLDGGAEGVLFRLCTYDKTNKHIVISLKGRGKYGKILLKQGIKIYTLNMKPNIFSFFSLYNLIKIIKIEKPDIVQTWLYHADLFGSIAAKIAGIKNLIWNVRHSNFDKVHTKKSLLLLVKILAKLSYTFPKKIIFCSKKSIKFYEQIGYDKKKITYIPNGYDLKVLKPNLFQKLIFKKKFNLNNKIPILGNVARFDPQKDHKNLLQALYLLKKDKIIFKCFLAGFMMNKQNVPLNQMIKKFELVNEIILLGSVKNINMIMNGIDFHILSSKFGEAFPNVVAEAMAFKKPCIVTDVGDSSIIVGKTGWIVKPNNSILLKNQIKKAINHLSTDKWNKICGDARKRINVKFNIHRMVNNYNRVWKKINKE
jgi:glycosyltransferase involved in cell wall biosynthesis